jgi:predicted metal-dependent hydrolase
MLLETATNRFVDPDLAYRLLIDAHRGLTDEASAALNSRLILILANQIGSLEVLRAAIQLAQSVDTHENPSEVPVRATAERSEL